LWWLVVDDSLILPAGVLVPLVVGHSVQISGPGHDFLVGFASLERLGELEDPIK
jgi:hypothetical protein